MKLPWSWQVGNDSSQHAPAFKSVFKIYQQER